MNIEELNSCFESITPTKEQRERILAGVMQAKNQPVKVIKFHRYASVAAAVFVIGIFAAVYPQISKNTIPVNVDTPTVALETGKEKVGQINETTVNETVNVTESVTDNTPVVNENTMTKKLQESYPQYYAGNTENMPAVAMNESVVVSENSSELYDNTDGIDKAMHRNSGGGGTSVQAVANYESLTYNQIMNHEIYSNLVPAYFGEGYALVSSEAYDDGSLAMHFASDDGKKMCIKVIKEELYNPENVITPEEIKGFEEISYSGFAVKCDDYYVYYSIDEGTAEDVYEMVTSSGFYN